MVAPVPEAGLDALTRQAEVAWIEDFSIRETHNEYGAQILGAPTAWALDYDGSTQTVAVADTGLASDYACDAGLACTGCAGRGGQNAVFTYGDAWPSDFPAAPLSGDLSAGNAEQMAAFSGTGPTDDDRIKPDVVAPGTWVLSGYSGLYQRGYDPSPNPQNSLWQSDGWGDPRSATYKYMGGTSMSTPLVAGGTVTVFTGARGHIALIGDANTRCSNCTSSNPNAACYMGWTTSSAGSPTQYGRAYVGYTASGGYSGYSGIGINDYCRFRKLWPGDSGNSG